MSTHLGDAAVVSVKGDAAQHQVAWLQVAVDDDALAAHVRTDRLTRLCCNNFIYDIVVD